MPKITTTKQLDKALKNPQPVTVPDRQQTAAQFPAKVGTEVLCKDGKRYHVLMTAPAHGWTETPDLEHPGSVRRIPWGNELPWAYISENKPSDNNADTCRAITPAELA